MLNKEQPIMLKKNDGKACWTIHLIQDFAHPYQANLIALPASLK
jgi:hypothetical protein